MVYASTLNTWLAVCAIMIGLVSGCATGDGTSGGKPDMKGSPPPESEQEASVSLPDGRVALSIRERETSEKPPRASSSEPPPEEAEPVTRAGVDRLLQKGPSYLFRVAELQPVRWDDEFRGFEIAALDRGASEVLSPQMQQGDVVTHVNGVRIQSPSDVHELWQRLDETSRIEIQFLRDGESGRAVWVIR